MKTIFRDPLIEEADHNIILQNRCGIRLSLLIHPTHTELEFVYKPNALRRREYRARNFSNRDNFTALFADSRLVELQTPVVQEFHYDPFLTRLQTAGPTGGKNTVSFLNIADENCFAIAARCPLTLALRPRCAYTLAEGLLTESFSDRLEEIVSFVSFPGIEENRYRVLDDGTHVLQLIEDDVILIGGEENRYHVDRALAKLRGLSLEQLAARNEKLLAPTLMTGKATVPDPDISRLLELNKRHTYSGIDEGGACFGSINRIYHLIWSRDGSIAAALYANTGFPQIARLWAPFLLANPAKIAEKGKTIVAWQQLFGTRWTKHEDDGLFYAAWAMFAHYQATGDDSLIHSEPMEILLQAIEDAVSGGFDEKLGLFISDTRGESSLTNSPYYGYDIVNGRIETGHFITVQAGKSIAGHCGSYQNVAQYNVMRMADLLLQHRPELRQRFGRDYAAFAGRLGRRINEFFLGPDGHYRPEWHIYSDGSSGFPDWMNIDYWEYPMALSMMPFHPNIPAAVESSRAYLQIWPTCRAYGFLPWNTMVSLLLEYGLPAAEARMLLETEIRESLALTPKYPMRGLITEYVGETMSCWRGLPISASSFAEAISGTLIKRLPQGIAIRSGGLASAIADFAWMIYRLDAAATGSGESVESVHVNGHRLVGTLQIPQSILRPGKNTVQITRGATHRSSRLHGSTLMLLDARRQENHILLEFAPCAIGEVVIENANAPIFRDSHGNAIAHHAALVPGSRLTIYTLHAPTGLILEVGG